MFDEPLRQPDSLLAGIVKTGHVAAGGGYRLFVGGALKAGGKAEAARPDIICARRQQDFLPVEGLGVILDGRIQHNQAATAYVQFAQCK